MICKRKYKVWREALPVPLHGLNQRFCWDAVQVRQVRVEHDSKILKGNLLGDPHLRKLGVWLPPQ